MNVKKIFIEIDEIKCMILPTDIYLPSPHPGTEEKKNITVIINIDGEDKKDEIIKQVRIHYEKHLDILEVRREKYNYSVSYIIDDITNYKF